MGDCKLFFFRVGNGHCTYIEFPNGENGLIDVKVSHENDNDNIITVFEKAGIKRIDNLFITHPHRDHITGLKDLINKFKVDNFYFSPVGFRPDPVHDDWLVYEEMKNAQHCAHSFKVMQNACTTVGDDVQIDYLAPTVGSLFYNKNVNDNGLVLRIYCRGHKIVIPGDIETDGWENVDDNMLRDITLLLASHHGNNSGFNRNKIRTMNPAFIVISSGPKTEHDADEKYKRIARKKVYTTRMKRIVARIDSKRTLSIID